MKTEIELNKLAGLKWCAECLDVEVVVGLLSFYILALCIDILIIKTKHSIMYVTAVYF